MFMANKQLHWLHWLCLLWTSNGHLPMQRPKGHATCSGSPCFCCPTLFFDLPWPTSKMMALWGRGCIFLQKTAAFGTFLLKPLLVQYILGLHHIVGDQLDAMRQGWIFSHPAMAPTITANARNSYVIQGGAFEVQETVDRL